MTVPVLTIDGPSGSGKGTIARRVAQARGWGLLDSGALYRLTALAAVDAGIALDNAERIADLAAELPVRFAANGDEEQILLNDVDVTTRVRDEATGALASQVAVFSDVRNALVDLQHSFRREPGLVADGRDMGTVIFPDAPVKIFLTASAAARAERRVLQLRQMGIDAKIRKVLSEIEERDARDASRSVAPLLPAEDAVHIDTTDRSIEQVVAQVVDLVAAI